MVFVSRYAVLSKADIVREWLIVGFSNTVCARDAEYGA